MKFFSGNKIMKASILDDGLQTSLLLHHNYHFVTLLLSHTQFSPLYQHKKKNYVAVTEIRIRTHFEEFDLNIFCHLRDFTVCIEAGVGFASCDITAFWLKSFSLSYRLSGPVECDVKRCRLQMLTFPSQLDKLCSLQWWGFSCFSLYAGKRISPTQWWDFLRKM